MWLLVLVVGVQAAPLTNVVALVVENGTGCGLKDDHTLWCWGDNHGPAAVKVAEDVAAAAAPQTWIHTDGGLVEADEAWAQNIRFPAGPIGLARWPLRERDAICALGADKVVRCVGDWALALGGPRGVDPTVPTAVPGLDGALELSAGAPCARFEEGQVRCLQVRGVKTVEIPPVVAFVGGDGETCGLLADGAVSCFPRTSKRDVPAGVDPKTAVVQRNLGCALASGTVVCWGDDAARWWPAARSAWRVGPLPDRSQRMEREQDDTPVCTREGTTTTCDMRLGSPTAPLVVLENVETPVLTEHQGCARSGRDLLCFGRFWLAHPGGVARFSDVVDFSVGAVEVGWVDRSGVVHRYYAGLAQQPVALDAVEVAIGEMVSCARTGDSATTDGTVWCWSQAPVSFPSVVHPVALDAPVHALAGVQDTICFDDTEDRCISDKPREAKAVAVEVAQ